MRSLIVIIAMLLSTAATADIIRIDIDSNQPVGSGSAIFSESDLTPIFDQTGVTVIDALDFEGLATNGNPWSRFIFFYFSGAQQFGMQITFGSTTYGYNAFNVPDLSGGLASMQSTVARFGLNLAYTSTTVSEPATIALLCLGLAGVGLIRRKRKI